jgi:Nucleoside-diphosphate-sugar epimerases
MSGSVLVTGASGFIGNFLIKEAIRKGYEVWAGVRATSRLDGLQDKNIHLIELDFAHPEHLRFSCLILERQTANGTILYTRRV